MVGIRIKILLLFVEALGASLALQWVQSMAIRLAIYINFQSDYDFYFFNELANLLGLELLRL